MLVRSSLTAPERETVITFSDEDDTATVHKHQRRIITKLRNNPAGEEIDHISFDIAYSDSPAASRASAGSENKRV